MIPLTLHPLPAKGRGNILIENGQISVGYEGLDAVSDSRNGDVSASGSRDNRALFGLNFTSLNTGSYHLIKIKG
jgi:hypothetical protein